MDRAGILEVADRAYLAFQAHPEWTWVDGSGPGGRPTAADIYLKYCAAAARTRSAVKGGESESTYSLGRLITRSYVVGRNYDTLEPKIITEFAVEMGYIL